MVRSLSLVWELSITKYIWGFASLVETIVFEDQPVRFLV